MKYQKYLDKYLSQEVQKQFIKYTISGGISYIAIFLSIFLLVDILGINSSIAFAVVYAIAYIVMFYVYTRHIFRTKSSKGAMVRYGVHLITFYILNNLTFNILIGILGLENILALILNIAFLFPLRFLSSKLLVFKE